MLEEIKEKNLNIEKLLGLFITLCSVMVAFFTGINTLWKIAANFFKSVYYFVDFNLYQVNFNFYQFLLITLVYLIIFAIFQSISLTIRWVWQFFKYKQKIQTPFWAKILSLIFLALVVLFCFISKITALLMVLYVILFGALFSIIFSIFLKVIKTDSKKEIASMSEAKEEKYNLFYLLSIFLLLEILLCFFSTVYSIAMKKDYYIIFNGEKNGVDVVIETYNDYYITKKAKLENNKLIIQKDSQCVHNVNDSYAYHKTFEIINYE